MPDEAPKRFIPPPAPRGEDNPSSYKSLQLKIKALEEERSALLARLGMDRDAEDGVITAERMRRILGQHAESDYGPTEKVLREMLSSNPASYLKRVEELERAERGDAEMEAEMIRLRARVEELERRHEPKASGPDEGTAAALLVIQRCLTESK